MSTRKRARRTSLDVRSLHDCGTLFLVNDEYGERDWMPTDAAENRSVNHRA
jgi:hypothetical protein